MKQEIKDLYRDFDGAHDRVTKVLFEMQKQENIPVSDLPELIDQIYALRELRDLAKAVANLAESCHRTYSTIACMAFVKLPDNSPYAKRGNIPTEYATGSPSIKYGANIPKLEKDPETFMKIMNFLGVPEELAKQEVVRPHWPSFVDYLSARLAQGLPLPDGISMENTYPIYEMVVRRKKGVIE